jgi:hypothetical protein
MNGGPGLQLQIRRQGQQTGQMVEAGRGENLSGTRELAVAALLTEATVEAATGRAGRHRGNRPRVRSGGQLGGLSAGGRRGRPAVVNAQLQRFALLVRVILRPVVPRGAVAWPARLNILSPTSPMPSKVSNAW